MGVAHGRLAVPFAERASCERRGGGSAALLRREDGLNASGTVNGGLLALVAEEAVLDARPGTTLASLSLCFLRPVRVGPAVATARSEQSRGGEGGGRKVRTRWVTRPT